MRQLSAVHAAWPCARDAVQAQPSPPTLSTHPPASAQTATTRAVEVHEMSRTSEHAGSILQLSQGMLHCLLKSALALEIDATGGFTTRALFALLTVPYSRHATRALASLKPAFLPRS